MPKQKIQTKTKKAVKKITKKSVVKKPVAKKATPKAPKEKLVGRVVHYFDKIGVAVIKFKDPIKTSDTIRIEGGENTDFKQKIASMEFDHKKVVKTKKNQEVGVKVKEKVHEGYKVYKL